MSQQQIALVTGGARGIGEAICRVLAAAGHKVVVTDISVGAGGNGCHLCRLG